MIGHLTANDARGRNDLAVRSTVDDNMLCGVVEWILIEMRAKQSNEQLMLKAKCLRLPDLVGCLCHFDAHPYLQDLRQSIIHRSHCKTLSRFRNQ